MKADWLRKAVQFFFFKKKRFLLEFEKMDVQDSVVKSLSSGCCARLESWCLRDGKTGVSGAASFSQVTWIFKNIPPTFSNRVGTKINRSSTQPLISLCKSTFGRLSPLHRYAPDKNIDHRLTDGQTEKLCSLCVFISGWLSLALTIPIFGLRLLLCLAR